MSKRVHYYHPIDERYTLTSVATDRHEFEEASDGKVVAYRLDETIYGHYTTSSPTQTVDDATRAADDDATWEADDSEPGVDATLGALSEDDRSIVRWYLQTYEGVAGGVALDADEERERYGGIDLEGVAAAIDDVDWDGSVVEVAGQLVSSLVSADALPSENHRTAIAFAHLYVASAEPEFSLVSLAADGEWRSQVHSSVADSKRLLAVRESSTTFRHLEEWGCDVVSLGDEVDVELAEYDLDVADSDAHSTDAAQLTELWTAFVTASVTRADAAHLVDEHGPDRAAFLKYLEREE